MTATNLNRSAVNVPVSTHAARTANETQRYRARDIGVGYGKSSGYARTRSFIAETLRGR